jgi:hypothetical protein
MRNLLKIILVLIVIASGIYFFRFEILYVSTKTGTRLDENIKTWGIPSYTGGDSTKIIYVYKKKPVNKYVFIFSKKDSILEKKWKEN